MQAPQKCYWGKQQKDPACELGGRRMAARYSDTRDSGSQIYITAVGADCLNLKSHDVIFTHLCNF